MCLNQFALSPIVECNMNRSVVIFSLICWLISSCAPSTPATQVEQDWSDTMKRYSLIGLYPITEDLQPGDVLLDIPPSDSAEPQPRLQRLGSLDPKNLLGALSDQEGRRLRFEAQKPDKPASTQPAEQTKPMQGSTVSTSTSAETGAAVTTTTTVKPAVSRPTQTAKQPAKPAKPDPSPAAPQVLGADTAQLEGKPLPRLRRVALPAITAARIYDWQIGGAGPIGRAAVALGLAGNGAAAVLVHLQNLELSGFDTLAALDLEDTAINDWVNDNNFTPIHLLRLTAQIDEPSARRMCRDEAVPPADERAVIQIVNRVLYAHDIEYEFTRSSQFAGRLAADIAQTATARTLVPAVATATSTTSTMTPSGTTGAGVINSEAARVAALSSALAANSPSTAGVRATFRIGMFGNVAMKEHHDAPMAVGFVSAANFTVRNSLVLSKGRSGQLSPMNELSDARKFCQQFFSEAEQSTSMIRPGTNLSQIENVICYNTKQANSRQSNRLPFPAMCKSAQPIAYEWTVGRQRRDARPHSVF